VHRKTAWSKTARTVCGLLGLALAAAGCGSGKSSVAHTDTATTTAGAVDPNATEVLPPGDIPDNQVFVAYSPAAGGYSLRYPQGWSQRRAGTAVTFSQNFNSIALTTSKSPAPPTTSSVRSDDVVKLQAVRGFKLVKIDSVTRTSGVAIRIVYDATSATDPVTGKTVTLEVERYLFWHKGTVVSLTLSSPKGSDNVDPWKTVTDSLVWK
jgi:hypothetical protein